MIGILNAYHFDTTPGNYQEKYMPMTINYLEKVLPGEKIQSYTVAQGEFPTEINECEGYIITGSPASCYDDEKWIKELIEFIKKLDQEKVPLLGICFGHQIIAHALGGEVIKSDKGWGIGVRTFDVFQYNEWMTPALSNNKCSLLFSHQDQVAKLPPNGVKLAGDSFCEFQIYSIEEHIFSVQGHPEFTVEYSNERYSTRIDRIGKEIYEEGIESLKKPTDHLAFGQWMRNFFSQTQSS